MVFDKIENMELYAGLPRDIYQGLRFLMQASEDIIPGIYQISQGVKAIVSEYETKPLNDNCYEAHRQFIDIQHVIIGQEKICYLPLDYLKETKAYSEDKDAAFFEEADRKPQELLLGNGYFAIFFPQDGHMPQLCVDKPEPVKKVVIKVRIGE